jgi:hypothetical protein
MKVQLVKRTFLRKYCIISMYKGHIIKWMPKKALTLPYSNKFVFAKM